jgi:hypothetical protein
VKLPTRRQAIIGLTFVVAGAVGFESWQAAAQAAETGRRPYPMLWPVTLEAFIAVLVLVYWEARSDSRKAGWARGLLAATTSLASTVQVLEVFASAPARTPRGVLALGAVTAAWTPIALLLTVEFATWLLYGKPAPTTPPVGVGERGQGVRPTASPGPTPRAPVPAAAGAPRAASASPPPARGALPSTPDRSSGVRSPAREQVRSLVVRERSGGPRATAPEVMAATGISQSRAFELLKQVRGEAPEPEKNGHASGVEVGA